MGATAGGLLLRRIFTNFLRPKDGIANVSDTVEIYDGGAMTFAFNPSQAPKNSRLADSRPGLWIGHGNNLIKI